MISQVAKIHIYNLQHIKINNSVKEIFDLKDSVISDVGNYDCVTGWL